MTTNATQEIILPDAPAQAPEASKFSLESLADAGLNANEIEMAKKHGFTEEGKSEEKKDEQKNEVPQDEQKVIEPIDGEDDQPDQHKEEDIQNFSRNEKALYWAQKKEREKRQRAEAERDQIFIQRKAAELRVQELEAKLKEPIRAESIDGELNIDQPEEEKPLTKKDLTQMEEERNRQVYEQERQRAVMRDALAIQELDAKSRYEDYDSVMELTHDVLKNADSLFTDKRERTKVHNLIGQFRWMAAHANEIGEENFNAADLGYELGKLHPKQKTASSPVKSRKQDGDLTPDNVKTMIENSRRVSSASITSSAGRRVVTPDDITVEEAARLSTSEFMKLPKATRERLKRS